MHQANHAAEFAGDPWSGEGAWLLLAHAGSDWAAPERLTLGRPFHRADLAVAFAELTEGWTWSSAWFILARLRWRDVCGQRQTVVQEQPEVSLGEFEAACPLWHNGGLCLQGQFLHLRVESAPLDPAGPADSAGPVHLAGLRLCLVDGALPILPSARALDRSKVAPQALGLEAVAALHWHIHM